MTKKTTKAGKSDNDVKPKTDPDVPAADSGNPPFDGGDSPPDDQTGKEEKKEADGMKSYFDTYPGEKELLRTSDGQVFLSKDKQWAALHQKSIDPAEEVQTIKR